MNPGFVLLHQSKFIEMYWLSNCFWCWSGALRQMQVLDEDCESGIENDSSYVENLSTF